VFLLHPISLIKSLLVSIGIFENNRVFRWNRKPEFCGTDRALHPIVTIPLADFDELDLLAVTGAASRPAEA